MSARAVGVVAGGLLLAVAAATAIGLPADDTAVLIASSFGVSLAAYGAGWPLRARCRVYSVSPP